jgi:hypothetical protein
MWITLLALGVGTLIGMTGTGSGVVLTPLLLIFTPYPALMVIGTDIVIGTVTRLLGVFEHKRLRQIRWRLAAFLIAGSIPGTLAGGALIKLLKSHLVAGELDHLLKTLLAIVLIAVAVFLPVARGRQPHWRSTLVDPKTIFESMKVLAIGALVGLLVAVTSIGSGSLMMIFLLLLTSFRAAELVGTDILFGVGTGLLASSLHLWMGHLDTGLFLRLLAGTLPGVIIGSRLTPRIPERHFSWVFSVLYLVLGARLLLA